MKRGIIFKFFLSILIFIGGCGYATNAYFLPSHMKSVHVETFRNKTDQPNLENEFRKKMISEFQSDGNLKIGSAGDADTILKGDILGYSREALRYDDNEDIREYRLTITVSFEFIDQANQEVVVKKSSFSGDTTFYLTGSSAKSESSAREDALDDLTRRLLNSITTLW